jgi:hypothetical protein
MKPTTLLPVLAIWVGCADHAYDPDAPAIDPHAPRVHIISPVRGTIAGDVATIAVTGTASDDSGVVTSVTVNGAHAVLAADGSWHAEVVVAPGTTLLHAIATDGQGNTGGETRAVVAGPMVSLDRYITNSIRATLSAQTLSALGRGTATFIEAGGLLTAAQGMNPVVDVGAGPDCLYAQASITSLTVGNADVLTGPTAGGVLMSAMLEDVRIGLRLQWAVSCFDGSRDVVVTAQRVSVQGLLAIGVVDRKLDVQFPDPQVQVTGFHVELPGVPDAIVQMLALDTTLGPAIGWATERLVVPMATATLSALDDTKTIDVAGMPVEVAVAPTQVSFTTQGGLVWLDTSMRARNDHGALVYVPNIVPPLEPSAGFQLAVADDAANQLLASLWSAQALDHTIDLRTGAFGHIGELYETVQLQAMVPPYVDANGDEFALTIGDWIATFALGNYTITVAIHATSDLYVVEDAGKLRIELATPTVYVDLVDDGAWLTNEHHDAIKAFAVDRIRQVGSAALAAVPVPAIGDAMPTNLLTLPEHGYLVITGDVH